MAPAIFIWEFITWVCVDMEVTLELAAYVRRFCSLNWTSCLARILHAPMLPVLAIFLISASWRVKRENKSILLSQEVGKWLIEVIWVSFLYHASHSPVFRSYYYTIIVTANFIKLHDNPHLWVATTHSKYPYRLRCIDKKKYPHSSPEIRAFVKKQI